jgi:hypothetical protein
VISAVTSRRGTFADPGLGKTDAPRCGVPLPTSCGQVLGIAWKWSKASRDGMDPREAAVALASDWSGSSHGVKIHSRQGWLELTHGHLHGPVTWSVGPPGMTAVPLEVWSVATIHPDRPSAPVTVRIPAIDCQNTPVANMATLG